MQARIEKFIKFVLDVKATTDQQFVQALRRNTYLFEYQNQDLWKKIINRQISLFVPVVLDSRPMKPIKRTGSGINGASRGSERRTDQNWRNQSASSNENSTVPGSSSLADSTKCDPYYLKKIQRLLRLICHIVEKNRRFFSIYVENLRQLIKSDDKNILFLLTAQLVVNLFENNNNEEEKKILREILKDARKRAESQFVTNFLELNPNNEEVRKRFLSEYLDFLYPFRASYTDISNIIRDSLLYFIDGDSLVLSLAHYVNLNLTNFHGNTIHLIYVFENILQRLYDIAQQYNSKLIFFDDHYEFYKDEAPILSLIRQTCIEHFKQNIETKGKIQVHRYSSCFDVDYRKFIQDERPSFIIYHDLSDIDKEEKKKLLSINAQEKLRIHYCKFGNFHQYELDCELYLTNNLSLDDVLVKSFHLTYERVFPFEKFSNQLVHDDQSEKIQVDHDDVRLSIYRTTIEQIDDKLIDDFGLFFIAHVALLVRLSIGDRHLTNSNSSIIFSDRLKNLIGRFQRQLVQNINYKNFPKKSWSKIGDCFDGRLLFSTFERIHRLKNSFRFDSKTMEIIQITVPVKYGSIDQSSFKTRFDKLFSSRDIVIRKDRRMNATTHNRQMKSFVRIENRLAQAFLRPIVESSHIKTFHAIQPDGENILIDPDKRIILSVKEVEDGLKKNYRAPMANPEEVYRRELNLMINRRRIHSNGQKIDSSVNLSRVLQDLKPVTSKEVMKGTADCDENLSNLNNDNFRQAIVEQKFRFQQKLLQDLRGKQNKTSEDIYQLERIENGYFTTLIELTKMRPSSDPFEEYRQLIEELLNNQNIQLEDWHRFQIEKMNSCSSEGETSVKDSRFVDFKLDTWQVEVLDAIDKNKSVIICAPTGTGKTSIASYAIENALSRSGVCLYVTSTEQFFHLIPEMFRIERWKSFGYCGFQEESNVESCQVLITTPVILEGLLMSSRYPSLYKKLEYCIIEEIQYASSPEFSDLWERITLLLPCPLIGLSESVSNSEHIQRWLQNIEIKRSELFKHRPLREVCLISHDEKLVDHQTYLYDNGDLQAVHPLSFFTGAQLLNRDLPRDFSLSPRDTYLLQVAMEKNITTMNHQSLTEYFQSDFIIKRNKFNQYKQTVIRNFQQVIKIGNVQQIDAILSSLKTIRSNDHDDVEENSTYESLGKFFITLKKKDLLPCIVFTESFSECQELAQILLDYISQHEQEQYNEAAFLNQTQSNNNDYKERLNNIRKKILHSCVKKGIGFNHQKLKLEDQLAIKDLFKRKYIQILFMPSSSTLLSHWPTKSIAFTKYPINLDAFIYRQICGRAGQRGLFNPGNIIFMNEKLPKIPNFILSRIPNVLTSIPFSLITFLRILQLYSQAGMSKDAVGKSFLLLDKPFIAEGEGKRNLINIQTRFCFMTAIEILYHMHLINENGEIIGLGYYHHEFKYFGPMTLPIIYLINNNAFGDVNDHVQLAYIFSHILGNLPWFESTRSPNLNLFLSGNVCLAPLTQPIIDKIDPFNRMIRESLSKYINALSDHLRSVMQKQEMILPFSKVSFEETSNYENGTFEQILHDELSQQENNPSISPFAGPSGLTHEHFISNFQGPMTAFDLAFPIDVSPKFFPLIKVEYRDHVNRLYLLNSFLWNFIEHGSENKLILENGMNKNEIFGYLSRPKMNFKMLSMCVKNLARRYRFLSELSPVLETLHQVFNGKLKNMCSKWNE